MNRIIAFSLTTIATFTAFEVFPVSAQAFSVITTNNHLRVEKVYLAVTPKDEYYRGLEDGINGAEYDNPRHSRAYDRGYKEGTRRRR